MGRWVHSSVKPIEPIDAKAILHKIEYACRTCYRSEDKITDTSAEQLIRNCIKRGHESVLEHASISFEIICDRGVSHELVRHRMASYSQESTRYCNYTKDKFNNELEFVLPWWTCESEDLGEREKSLWWDILNELCFNAEEAYKALIANGATPDVARSVLPNCLRTKVVMTMNIRELRHFLRLRLSKAAHPDIRYIAWLIYQLLIKCGLSILFEDLVLTDGIYSSL